MSFPKEFAYRTDSIMLGDERRKDGKEKRSGKREVVEVKEGEC